MKIKKIISYIALISFTWTTLIAQTYDDSARLTDEAEALQNDGEYKKSYDKSQEASDSIYKTSTTIFYKLFNLKIQKSKNDANKAITEIKQLGLGNDNQFKIKYDEAMSNFNNANEAMINLPSPNTIPENEEQIIKASNNFNDVLSLYNSAINSAFDIKEAYLNRERTKASKAIEDAKNKYNSSKAANNVIVGGSDEKNVLSYLDKADKALKEDGFDSVQQNVKSALEALSKAEAAAKAKAAAEAKAKAEAAAKAKKAKEIEKAKQDIQNAKRKYNDLIGNNTIIIGDENDNKVSALLSDANKVLETNPIQASEKANQASSKLDAIIEDKNNSILREENKKHIENLKNRYNDLMKKGFIIINSDDDKKFNIELKSAENAVVIDNQKLARENIEKANTILNAINEKGIQRPFDGEIVEGDINDNENNNTGQIIDNITDSKLNIKGKVTVLPKYYTVVRRVPLTDALWRIAGYSYIYNNPLQWYKIYQANRNILRDPDNPDLILPGQRLVIPAINGEERSGQYNPKLEYITYDEAIKLKQQKKSNSQ